METIRLPNGVYCPSTDDWGTNLAKIADPEAEYGQVLAETFVLSDDLAKIPKQLWNATIEFFRYFASRKLVGKLEATVGFYYSFETRTWRCLVPKQTVTGVTVNCNYSNSLDILDGSPVNEMALLASGYRFLGRCHSHHTMMMDVPSSTDDETEIPVQQLCILVSKMSLSSGYYKITLTATRTVDKINNRNRRYWNLPQANNLHYLKLIDVGAENLPDTEEAYPEFLVFPEATEPYYHPHCLGQLTEQINLPVKAVRPALAPVGYDYSEFYGANLGSYTPQEFTLVELRKIVQGIFKYNFKVTSTDIIEVVLEEFGEESIFEGEIVT